MKKIIASVLLLASGFTVLAQPKIVERAIIKAKTEITFPENFSFGGGPGGGGPGGGGGTDNELSRPYPHLSRLRDD